MLSRIVTPVTRSLFQQRNVLAPTARFAAGYEDAPKPPTMDDLPVPSGSWETQYNANQARYNRHLALGVVFATFTFIVVKSSGLIYLNFSPPAHPDH